MEIIRVGIIEDDATINQSLSTSIEMYPALELAFNAFSVEEAFDMMDKVDFKRVDVLLLDIGLPGMDGLTAIPHIRQRLEKTDIIMLTTYDENEKIFQALSSGACSYISKKTSLKVIMDSIFTVFRGGSYMSPSIARKIAQHFMPVQQLAAVPKNTTKLTDRQLEIVEALSKGLSYKLIAVELGISIDTVRTHIKKIYRSLAVNSKIEVINLYRDGEL